MKKYRKFVKEFYSQNKEIEANRLFKSQRKLLFSMLVAGQELIQ